MSKLSLKLWKALQELKDNEFKTFKWFLKQDDISVARLEKADRQDTVDLMVQRYGNTGAVKETMTVLERISRNDLVRGLENSCSDPEDLRPPDLPKHDRERKKAELKSVQTCSVDVTLDPKPVRSGGGEPVHCGDVRTKLPTNPESFYRCVCWSGQRSDLQEERSSKS